MTPPQQLRTAVHAASCARTSLRGGRSYGLCCGHGLRACQIHFVNDCAEMEAAHCFGAEFAACGFLLAYEQMLTSAHVFVQPRPPVLDTMLTVLDRKMQPLLHSSRGSTPSLSASATKVTKRLTSGSNACSDTLDSNNNLPT